MLQGPLVLNLNTDHTLSFLGSTRSIDVLLSLYGSTKLIQLNYVVVSQARTQPFSKGGYVGVWLNYSC